MPDLQQVLKGDSIMASLTNDPSVITLELAFTQKERDELARARTLPIVFDEDCPETTPEQAIKFKRVNPVRRTTVK